MNVTFQGGDMRFVEPCRSLQICLTLTKEHNISFNFESFQPPVIIAV